MHKLNNIALCVVLESGKNVWERIASPLDGVERFYRSRADGVQLGFSDAVGIREQFMSITTEAQALEFLNGAGVFEGHREDCQLGWTLDHFRVWQEFFAELAKELPERWHELMYRATVKHPEVSFIRALMDVHGSDHLLDFPARVPLTAANDPKRHLVIRTRSVVKAIIASIRFDSLRGAKFRVCARNDCFQFFEPKTAHARKYCTTRCAHTDSQRRSREKQNKGRKKKRTESAKPYAVEARNQD